jgi:hypothetical protein
MALTWAAFLPLIIQYGPEVAAQIWALVEAGKPPTDADWAALLVKTKVTAKQAMAVSFARNNIDPNSPMGVALLAMAG